MSEGWKDYYPELDMTKEEAIAYSRKSDIYQDLRDYIGDIVSYWLKDVIDYGDPELSGRVFDSWKEFVDNVVRRPHKHAVKAIGGRRLEEFAYHVVDLYTGKISPEKFISDKRWSNFYEDLRFWWYFWGYKEENLGRYNIKDPDIGWW